MAENDTQSVESADSAQLAKERVAWALYPLAIITVTLFWVLNPAIVDTVNIRQPALGGFLLGAGIALLGYRRDVLKYFNWQMNTGVYRPNRIPEEFYWGFKAEELRK